MVEGDILIIYMDDILIFAKTQEELEERTKQTLARLREHDLYLKPKKCEFNKTKIEYLGMVIEEGKISMDTGKLKGIQRLACTYIGQTGSVIPRLWKFLPSIHQEILGTGTTTQ